MSMKSLSMQSPSLAIEGLLLFQSHAFLQPLNAEGGVRLLSNQRLNPL